MPTPSEQHEAHDPIPSTIPPPPPTRLPSSPPVVAALAGGHATFLCPESDRPESQRHRRPHHGLDRLAARAAGIPMSSQTHDGGDSSAPKSLDETDESVVRRMKEEEQVTESESLGGESAGSSPAPSSSDLEAKESEAASSSSSSGTTTGAAFSSSHSTAAAVASVPTGYGFPHSRIRPSYSSSFLRPGSKFVGTQQSDKQVYKVEVNIKHVDMKESFLCGYLRIEGLTPDHATLTTYWEGEIIGPKYTFQTKHESWGATEKTDMQHWDRFPAWRPLARLARKPDFHYKDCSQKENIFMRWKEYFLVPDHRVREISGASFEGFYYICFNQVSGTVSGIYFHAKSEKYQQLELKHVNDMGCLGAVEFR